MHCALQWRGRTALLPLHVAPVDLALESQRPCKLMMTLQAQSD